eukprot:365743-Chlamydomonas_euryale.AAC.33
MAERQPRQVHAKGRSRGSLCRLHVSSSLRNDCEVLRAIPGHVRHADTALPACKPPHGLRLKALCSCGDIRHAYELTRSIMPQSILRQ